MNLSLEKRQLCDIQGRLFQLALKNGYDCSKFIESFMNSKAALALDDTPDTDSVPARQLSTWSLRYDNP